MVVSLLFALQQVALTTLKVSIFWKAKAKIVSTIRGHSPTLRTSNAHLQIDIQEYKAALQGEEELQKFCEAIRPELLKADAAGLTESMASNLPDVDKDAMLKDHEMGQLIVDSFHEGLRNNSDGWVDDDLAFIVPWGFDLNEVKVPVILYQGTEDKMVPYAQGVWLAEHLPQEKLRNHLLPGEGHVSIFLGKVDNMTDELLEIAKLK